MNGARAGGSTRRRPPQGRDAGQLTVLILGFLVILMLLVSVVIDVTAVQMARIRLMDVADAAALDAADSVAERVIYSRGVGRSLQVTDESVRQAADGYLASRHPPAQVTSWRLEPQTGSPDGRSALVRLTGSVELPLAQTVWTFLRGPVTVSAEGRAESRVRRVGPVAGG